MNLSWANGGKAVLPAIYAKTDEHWNLAHVFDPCDRMMPFEQRIWDGVDPMKTILSVDTVDKTYSLPHLMPAGAYRFYLTISSSDTDPLKKVIELELGGQWYGDAETMRTQGVAVRLLNKMPKE